MPGTQNQQQSLDVRDRLTQVTVREADRDGHHAAGHGAVERASRRWGPADPGAEGGHELDVAAAHAAEGEEREEHQQTVSSSEPLP